jgi:hypothetical protein
MPRILLGIFLFAFGASTAAAQTVGPSPASGGGVGGNTPLSALTSATKTNSFDNAAFPQTFTWNSLSTQTAFTLSAPGLTTGTVLKITSTGTAAGAALSVTGNVSFLSGTTTVNNFSVIGTCIGCVGRPSVYAVSLYTTDTSGQVYPAMFTGAGGNASPSDAGWGVAASLSADKVLQMRFQLPSLIPGGTLNLISYCLANAGSGTAKYTISDADVAAGSSLSSASLSAETQSSLSITTTGAYLVTATPLTATPSANDVLVSAVTFNTSGWTLATQLVCRWVLQWR